MPRIGDKSADRDSKGRFVKGNRSTGGRKKLPEELREMCRALAPGAIETAKAIMLDTEAPPRDRLRAAEIILDRGYGKPEQAVTASATDADGTQTLGIVLLPPRTDGDEDGEP